MYFDWTYLILVLPAAIFAMWASSRVTKTFQQYRTQRSLSGITGAQAARRILDANGLAQVQIEHISGELTDHYDPKANVVRLSDGVYNDNSTAAVGIACHEVGHALQYACGYGPVKLRMAIIPVTQVGSKLALPLILIGLFLNYLSGVFLTVAYVGIGLFALSTFFQLVTLPVEYNASNRALQQIQEHGILRESEMLGAKSVLSAAALTYVAALAVSLMQLLRFLILVGGRRSRD